MRRMFSYTGRDKQLRRQHTSHVHADNEAAARAYFRRVFGVARLRGVLSGGEG